MTVKNEEQLREVYAWLTASERRQEVIVALTQPLTGRQVAKRLGRSGDQCSVYLRDLARHGLVRCLNPKARRSRLYWLTRKGVYCRGELRQLYNQPHRGHKCPSVNWKLLGWVCFTHRRAVIKALNRPLQPPAIKRRARLENPELRMSANNVREVIKLFLARGIVRPVKIPRQRYLHYELTEDGRRLRELVIDAETL